MKKHWSRYNFLFESNEGKYLLYNSYTNNLMEIEEYEACRKLLRIKEDDFYNIGESLVEELSTNFILVDDDEILYHKIRIARLKARFDTSTLSLTIVPTLACNFACPYCYEENIDCGSAMSDDTAVKILDFIRLRNNAQNLFVAWYGGEPLLAFDRIESMTEEFKKLSIKSYSALIVTNGYLLSTDKIKKMKQLNITQMQVTLDGLEKTHNARRPHKSNSNSFQKIVANLKNLAEIYPEIRLSIRVNLDKKNTNEFSLLDDYLNDKLKMPNLHVYPAYIKDYNPCKTSFCQLDREDQALFALGTAQKKSSFIYNYYPQTILSECSARHIDSYTIGPKGDLYKCWCDVGNPQKCVGSVDDGIINDNLYMTYLALADPLEDSECKKCSYFPVCDCGCTFNRIKNIQRKDKIDICLVQKEKIDKFLSLYYTQKSKL